MINLVQNVIIIKSKKKTCFFTKLYKKFGDYDCLQLVYTAGVIIIVTMVKQQYHSPFYFVSLKKIDKKEKKKVIAIAIALY